VPDELAALQRAVRDLHRELLDAQRIDAERFSGRMSSGEVLQAAVDDLRFGWLRTLSEAIGDLDAAASADDQTPAAAVERLRRLLAPPDPASAFGGQYLRALQRHPGVVLAHASVTRLLPAGPEAADDVTADPRAP
jgi:hypothetical protein